MKHTLFAMMAALGVAAYSGHAQAASNYAALDISALVDPTDFHHYFPGGLNDLGQVVGSRWDTSSGQFVGFVTGANGSGFTNLPAPVGYDYYTPFAVNNQGQMAGLARTRENFFNPTVLKTGPNGTDPTYVAYFGQRVDLLIYMNERGQIAGTYPLSFAGDRQGFVTGANGVGLTDIGNLGGIDTIVSGLNDRGQVVGRSRVAGTDYESHAYITGPDGVGITDLGTLGGTSSWATGINEKGQVVGGSDLSGDRTYQAFITGANGTNMSALLVPNSLVSAASAINDSGVVVGSYTDEGGGGGRGFITGPDGVSPTELKAFLPEGVYASAPLAINNQGQILVLASSGRVYLLTPVPEPEVAILALCGLGMVAGAARRRGLVRPAV